MSNYIRRCKTHDRYKSCGFKGRQPENHHIWQNRGTWWTNFTVTDGVRSIRVRKSLGTSDAKRARELRDKIFADIDSGKVTSL